ncbi:MAG: hypothetical protein WC784_06245, partial [Candidatus Shapirobacteria bacterium]
MIFNLNSTKITSRVQPLFAYLQKQRENQKFIRSLEIGATFLLISFFALFAIKPTLITISALVGEVKSKELLQKDLKGKINDVITAQDLFSQVQEKYSLVESSLPGNPRFFQAATQINLNANNYQISLNKLNFIANDSNSFSVSVGTVAAFPTILSLISDITQNRR